MRPSVMAHLWSAYGAAKGEVRHKVGLRPTFYGATLFSRSRNGALYGALMAHPELDASVACTISKSKTPCVRAVRERAGYRALPDGTRRGASGHGRRASGYMGATPWLT